RATDLTKSSPGTWLAYNFDESLSTELTVTRRRIGGTDVQARCLFVRADDKWLLASVAPGFEGNRLVGRLIALDSASSPFLLESLRKVEPNRAALLPFEFHAVEGSASDQQLQYTAAALIGGLGLAGMLLGLWMVRKKGPTPSTVAAAVPTQSSFLPLANR